MSFLAILAAKSGLIDMKDASQRVPPTNPDDWVGSYYVHLNTWAIIKGLQPKKALYYFNCERIQGGLKIERLRNSLWVPKDAGILPYGSKEPITYCSQKGNGIQVVSRNWYNKILKSQYIEALSDPDWKFVLVRVAKPIVGQAKNILVLERRLKRIGISKEQLDFLEVALAGDDDPDSTSLMAWLGLGRPARSLRWLSTGDNSYETLRLRLRKKLQAVLDKMPPPV